MSHNYFTKSDAGAQAAWRGFTSQTLYIASRIVTDEQGYEYYPEDVEDLLVRKNGSVVEAVQVKSLSTDLTVSSLATSGTSKGGEGFFNRMCNLHIQFPSFDVIRVVYFGSLGTELQEVNDNDDDAKIRLSKKLQTKHALSCENANWLINSLKFEKVDTSTLESTILSQINTYVPTMAAPDLANELLIQYISKLSASKGFTTLDKWQKKIHSIGVDISAIDGFYKEYNKSLVCLKELKRTGGPEQLRHEFSQGVAAQPSHIRLELDFKRAQWSEEIERALEKSGVAIVKGVSGQGKSTLCYRYLIDSYPEGCVFCVRAIASEGQAQNLVAALDGLGKHNNNLIIYIDVKPGETLWTFLLQELQSRGLSIPVLISIRDEDYNSTPVNGKAIKYSVIELALSAAEAKEIFNLLTEGVPHQSFRTFDDAWQSFGGSGPLIEFVYMLTHNQTLTERLQNQIDALLLEKIDDTWLELLLLVCYAGRLGCAVGFNGVKRIISCSSMQSAIKRFKDEYLIRITDNNELEALHSVRAQIVYNILCDRMCRTPRSIVFKTLPCVSSKSVRPILMDYFSHCEYSLSDIRQLAGINFSDWIGYASAIKSMIWLDARRYVDGNMSFINELVKKYGKGWLCFFPLDLTGMDCPNVIFANKMKDLSMMNSTEMSKAIDQVERSLTSLSIDYQATDIFIRNCAYPISLPYTDDERSLFGYALFWMAKRSVEISLPFPLNEVVSSVCTGEIQPCADAIRGLYEQPRLLQGYNNAVESFLLRLIPEMSVIQFNVTDEEVTCKFVPPIMSEDAVPADVKNANQYWRIKMLDILQQLYPMKEYINIELIGVDLLADLGIEPFDYRLNIQKSNRHDSWITEVNGWMKNRIDYCFRPSSWGDYIYVIDNLRTGVNDLILETIKIIDIIYSKGHFTKERGKRIDDRIGLFKARMLHENLLPKSAVDSYCLYSEETTKNVTNDYFYIQKVISSEKYKRFRELLNRTYTSINNFYNQFSDVLIARSKGKELDTIKNPRLAMFNLFSAAKLIIDFQREYDMLFSRYSSLDSSFARSELENILTLVNIWRYVLDNSPKGYAIAYDAKLKYRKGTNYFSMTLEKAVDEVGGTLIISEHYAYIIVNCDVSEDSSLESEYQKTVLRIRNIFNSAISPSSDRWYVETQPLQLAYVPIVFNTSAPVAYSIPFYKLFDTDDAHISDSILPCDIEPELSEHIYSGSVKRIWTETIQSINLVKLHLQRYSQVLRVPADDKCSNSIEAFMESTIQDISVIWSGFSPCEAMLNEFYEGFDEQEKELINCVQEFFGCYKDIEACIINKEDLSIVIETIDRVVKLMFLMQPYLTKHSSEIRQYKA